MSVEVCKLCCRRVDTDFNVEGGVLVFPDGTEYQLDEYQCPVCCEETAKGFDTAAEYSTYLAIKAEEKREEEINNGQFGVGA
jgi:hypothetical protein